MSLIESMRKDLTYITPGAKRRGRPPSPQRRLNGLIKVQGLRQNKLRFMER